MSILDINKKNGQIRKTVTVYMILAIMAIAFNKVYSLFGHGVSSLSMSFMFLFPMLGGALFYFVIGLIIPKISENNQYRLFYNIYNSGIAILTVGSLLKGIFDIAGTASPYIYIFTTTGCICVATGLLFVLATALRELIS